MTMRGIPRPIYLRQITNIQLRKCFRKCFQLYASHVEDPKEGKEPKLQDYPMLQEFVDVFQELLRIPPKRENFTIDLVSSAIPSSKAPYKMSSP